MFIEIYKCKMCGEEIQKAHINAIVADTEIFEGKQRHRHFCENGDIGILEFAGYKYHQQ